MLTGEEETENRKMNMSDKWTKVQGRGGRGRGIGNLSPRGRNATKTPKSASADSKKKIAASGIKNNDGKKDANNEEIDYVLGRGDKWVGDISKEDNFVKWALIDNAHEYNPTWRSVFAIEKRIQELENINKYVKNYDNKKCVNDIIEKWQVRNKKLIIEKSNKERKKIEMEVIEIDDDYEQSMNCTENNMKQDASQRKVSMGNTINESLNKDKIAKEQNKGQNNSINSNEGVYGQSSYNSRGNENTNNKKSETLADIVRKSKVGQTMIPNIDSIRIRLSFMWKKDVTNIKNKYDEIRRVLIRSLEIANKFDKNAAILPWKVHGKSIIVPADIRNIYKMTNEQIGEYIDMKSTENNLGFNKMCHGYGMNIKTQDDITTFLDKWNQVRFESKIGNKSNEWIGVKRAEVQKYHNSIPVGFFQGSSENGINTIINEELGKQLGVQVEVSFQNIYVRGITGQFWDNAKKEARKHGEEGTKEFRKKSLA